VETGGRLFSSLLNVRKKDDHRQKLCGRGCGADMGIRKACTFSKATAATLERMDREWRSLREIFQVRCKR